MSPHGFPTPVDEYVVHEVRPHWIQLVAACTLLAAPVAAWLVVGALVWARAAGPDGSGPPWPVYVIPLVLGAVAIIRFWDQFGKWILITVVGVGACLGVPLLILNLAEVADTLGSGIVTPTWGTALVLWVLAALVALPLLFAAVRAFTKWLGTRIVVTSQRLIIRTGLVQSASSDVFLRNIQSVDVDQGVVGHLLGYGDLELAPAGLSYTVQLDRFPEPEQLRETFTQLALWAGGAGPWPSSWPRSWPSSVRDTWPGGPGPAPEPGPAGPAAM